MFIILTAAFCIGYFCFIRLLYAAMQEGELFDIVSRGAWSRWIKRMYATGNKLEYLLGGCEKCTSFWWALPYCGMYITFMCSEGYWTLSIIGSFIWACVFWTILAIVGLVSLNQYNRSQENV